MSELPTNIHVINLDSATERWASVEASHALHLADSGIQLVRHRAMSAAEAKEARIAGRCTWPEKGCYISHLLCLEAQANKQETAWIAEDDVMFDSNTVAILQAALQIAGNLHWDVIFTNVGLGAPLAAFGNFPSTNKLNGDAVALTDLRGAAYYGAYSYLINPKSVEKLFGSIRAIGAIDTPIDILLKRLCFSGRIAVFSTTPFSSSLSGAPSQIQI